MKKVVQNISWLILGLFLVLLPLNTKADSGWDNSYDSGGSYSSSDSWSSSDYDYSSGGGYSSGSYSGGWPAMVGLTILIIIIAIMYISRISKSKVSSNLYSNNANIPLAVQDAFKVYVKIQNAWSQFDYKTLEELLSDELYNNYKMQLETLKMKKQQNLMENFDLMGGHIVNSQEVNGHLEMVISMTVRLKDYVINTTNNQVVRGTDQRYLEVNYEITLIKEQGKQLENCPSCGAPIKDKGRSVCEYCGATIVQGTDKYVMSKKETKNQKML